MREARESVDDSEAAAERWSSLEVRLVDLSPDGFRAECEATDAARLAIRIDLPGLGEIEAQVTSRRDGKSARGSSFRSTFQAVPSRAWAAKPFSRGCSSSAPARAAPAGSTTSGS